MYNQEPITSGGRVTNPVLSFSKGNSKFRELGAGAKKFEPAPKVIPPAAEVFAPAYIFYSGGGGEGDIKCCMINTRDWSFCLR